MEVDRSLPRESPERRFFICARIKIMRLAAQVILWPVNEKPISGDDSPRMAARPAFHGWPGAFLPVNAIV
jgi:hypothetical protein